MPRSGTEGFITQPCKRHASPWCQLPSGTETSGLGQVSGQHTRPGEESLPCTSVPRWSIWNTALAHRGGSMGASVETLTGNPASHTTSLSPTTTLPAWRDMICSLSFPLRSKSEMAGGKEFST